MTYQPPSPPSIKEAMKTIDSMLDDDSPTNDIEIGGSSTNNGLQGGHPVDIMPNNKLTPTFNSKGKFQSYEQQPPHSASGTTPTTNSNNVQDALTLANQIESSPYGFHFDKKSKVDIKEEIKKKEEDRKKKEQEVALQQMLANPSGMNWDDLVASMKKKKKKKSKKKSRKSSRRSRSSKLLDIDGSSVASGSSGFRCSPIDESIDELDEEEDEEEEIDFEQKEESPYGIGNGSTFDVEYGGSIPEDVDEIDFHPPTYDITASSLHTANGMTVADQINELIEECQISSDKAYEMVVKYEGQEMVLLNHLKELRDRMLSSPESGGISHSGYADYNMSYDTGVNVGYTNKRRRKCAIGFAILVLLAGIVGGVVVVAVKNSSSNVPEEFGGPSATADSSTPDVTDQVEDADKMPTIEGDNEYSGEYDEISYGYETGQDQSKQEAIEAMEEFQQQQLKEEIEAVENEGETAIEATKEEFQQQHPELDGETSQETVIKEEIEAVENEGETNAEESDIIYPWSRQ